MRGREVEALLKIADDLHRLAVENTEWCKENRGVRSSDLIHMKSGQASAYQDSVERIINFVKTNGDHK